MTPRKAELCAGYGGLSASVEATLATEIAWYAEYDPTDSKQHSSKILAHHWPGVPNLGDITAIDWATVEPVHILLGGYPCQGQSVAGKQLGEKDPRWLWPHVATAVRALRPLLVFFENVRNHLRIGFDTVLGDLTDAGYDVAWTTIKASAIGAPHHRDRLFILGVLRGADMAPLGLVAGAPQIAGAPLAVRRGGVWLDAYESLFGAVSFTSDLPDAGTVRDGVLAPLDLVAAEVPGGPLQQTPTGNLGSNGGSQDPEKRRGGGHGPTLADEVEHLTPRSRRSSGELLPTPRTSDANGTGAHGTGGPDLRTVVSALLPTPTVADSRDSRNKTAGRKPGSKHHDGTTLVDAVVMLRARQEQAANGDEASPGRAESAAVRPTPRARDWKNGGKDGLEELLTSRRSPAALGATPRATDGTKGGPNQRGSSGDLMLPSVAAGLAHDGFDWSETPYAAAIRRWERVLDRPAPGPVNERGRLATRFVEWMQGLPDGWVTEVPGLPRNSVLKALGNGVVKQQGAAAFRLLLGATGLDWQAAVEREYGHAAAVAA